MAEWVTLGEADTYLGDKRNGATWLALDGATRQALLTEAFRHITSDPAYSIPPSPAGAALQRLADAQAELAFHLMATSGELTDPRVVEEQYGRVRKKYSDRIRETGGDYPRIVRNLLTPFASGRLSSQISTI